MKQTTISIQDLSGAWSQLGTGTLRGIQPSDIELVSDTWGPKDATFTLNRELFVPWPDIQAYAPVEITVGGVIVWRGRIVDAPTNSSSRSIAVRCEGKQNHLDDDQYEKIYAHTDITQWVDIRTAMSADLTRWTAAPTVSSGGGTVSIGWPKNVAATTPDCVGLMLDLGPSAAGAKYMTLDYRKSTGGPSNLYLYARAAPDPANFLNPSLPSDEASWSNIAGTSWPSYTTRLETAFSSGYRYVCVFLYCGTSYTPGADDIVIIDGLAVYTDAAYYDAASDRSILRGDHIVKDALDSATVQLSSDQSLIASTGSSFYIPEFAPSGPRTARQAIEAANVFYDWRTKVDESDRFVFQDRTGEAPAVRVGRWGSSSFEDASSASGDEIYNLAIVTGQDQAGNPVRAKCHHAPTGVPESPYLDNPSADVDASGWSTGGAANWTVTRDNALADTGPGSIRFDKNAGAYPFQPYTTFTGTFEAGKSYRLSGKVRASAAASMRVIIGGVANYTDERVVIPATTWTDFEAYWQPKANESGILAMFYMGSGGNTAAQVWFDSLKLETLTSTLVDRRGFRRTHTLDASFMLTTTSANRLGQIFLEAHRTTPFKGQGQIVGHNAARDYATGLPVAPERLLLMTDRLMHFDDRVNPDTGAVGRDGRIVNVRYTPANDTATFDIDNSRKDFDALLERLGVSIGQIR